MFISRYEKRLGVMKLKGSHPKHAGSFSAHSNSEKASFLVKFPIYIEFHVKSTFYFAQILQKQKFKQNKMIHTFFNGKP